MQSRRQAQSGGLSAQLRQQRLKQVEPLDLDAGLQTREKNSTRATGDLQHRAIGLAGQPDVEVEAVIEAPHDGVEGFAVFKRRGEADGGVVIHEWICVFEQW